MPPEGILLIDKPAGITSHDVVDIIRHRFGLRRVGHGGTLDPAATGLLILLLGRATQQASRFLGMDKTYLATLRLGVATDTQDAQGKVVETRPVGPLTLEEIESACDRFRGEVEQKIPAYSAVRTQGKRFYELARAGQEVPQRFRRVTVKQLKVVEVRLPEVHLEVTCSSGTYIRTLCADIGEALGVSGHMSQLTRTRVGPYILEDAAKLEQVGSHHLLAASS